MKNWMANKNHSLNYRGFHFFQILFLCATLIYLTSCSGPKNQLPTYFTYSPDEIKSVSSQKSDQDINPSDLFFWDEKAYELVGKNKSGSTGSKLYAYLLVAQKDAATLSYNAHGKYLGNLNILSKEILCAFYPDDCGKLPSIGKKDEFSETLSRVVMAQVRKRMSDDDKTTKVYEAKEGDEFWKAMGKTKGQDAGSWKTWLIEGTAPYRLSPPPDPKSDEMKQQLETVKNTLVNATEDQKKAAITWAGSSGTRTEAGIWMSAANEYLKGIKIDLPKLLLVRATLAMGLADVEIAASDSKYTYWEKRPFMLDENLHPYIPTPNHPSYPSGAACAAGTASTILTHFFPDQKAKWDTLASDARNSRLWSGIHFSHDIDRGFDLGRKVGEKVIQTIKSA